MLTNDLATDNYAWIRRKDWLSFNHPHPSQDPPKQSDFDADAEALWLHYVIMYSYLLQYSSHHQPNVHSCHH